MDIGRLGFVLSHWLAMVLLAAIAYILGRRILLKYSFDSRIEELAFSTGLGLGVLVWIVMLLGFLHLLHWWIAVPVLIACLLACLPVYRSWTADLAGWIRKVSGSWGRIIFAVIVVALIIAALLPILLIPLYPPTGHDATS